NSVIMYATSAFTLTTTNQSLSSGTRHPPATTLFPYTTLFRSDRRHRPPPGPRLPARALRWDAPARDHRDGARAEPGARDHGRAEDRKSTRLNSSHDQISYAVFCLKKKRKSNE